MAEDTNPKPAEDNPEAAGKAKEQSTALVVAGNKALITPEEAKANPFKAIAMLLEGVNTALNESNKAGEALRWIRIARLRNFQRKDDYISKPLILVVDLGFIKGVSQLVRLTLLAQDLLTQADAAKALWEVAENMLEILTSDDFYVAAMGAVSDTPPLRGNPLSGAQPHLKKVGGFINKIPTPQDLNLIGQQLYKLLNITQKSLTGLKGSDTDHIDIESSGKVRLLQMALTASAKTNPDLVRSITIYGLRKKAEEAKKEETEEGTPKISWLGGRRVTKDLPTSAKGVWEEETIYDFNFDGVEQGKDIEEANRLLEAMGYPALTTKTEFNDDFVKQLRRFQTVNKLKITGQLDNPTLNRLWHLDFDNKTLKRAEPWDGDKITTEQQKQIDGTK